VIVAIPPEMPLLSAERANVPCWNNWDDNLTEKILNCQKKIVILPKTKCQLLGQCFIF
jgi:5-methylcytosine-specific restriction endonuclease McrA